MRVHMYDHSGKIPAGNLANKYLVEGGGCVGTATVLAWEAAEKDIHGARDTLGSRRTEWRRFSTPECGGFSQRRNNVNSPSDAETYVRMWCVPRINRCTLATTRNSLRIHGCVNDESSRHEKRVRFRYVMSVVVHDHETD